MTVVPHFRPRVASPLTLRRFRLQKKRSKILDPASCRSKILGPASRGSKNSKPFVRLKKKKSDENSDGETKSQCACRIQCENQRARRKIRAHAKNQRAHALLLARCFVPRAKEKPTRAICSAYATHMHRSKTGPNSTKIDPNSNEKYAAQMQRICSVSISSKFVRERNFEKLRAFV